MITANTWFRMPWNAWKKGRLDKQAARFQVKLRDEPIDEEPVLAHVSRGAWLVRCPEEGCRGVEYAWEEGNFVCCSCLNNGVGHRIRRAKFPEDRAEIEKLLERRPLLNRNWYPGETLDQLAKENDEHAGDLLPISEEGGNE